MTLLGFDFGSRRIGIAVGQTLTASASPLAVIRNRNGRPDWEAITQLISEWQPDALIVGLPQYADGSTHPLVASIARFCRQLQGRYHLPVHSIDESLSSDEAARRMGGKQPALDAGAAAVILETWLAHQQHMTAQK